MFFNIPNTEKKAKPYLYICFLLFFSVLNLTPAFSQIPDDDIRNCDGSCSASDLDITPIFVADSDGNAMDHCETGTTVTGFVWLVIVHGNNGNRNAFRIGGDLVINGVDTGTDIIGCIDNITAVNGQSDTVMLDQPISWTCGDSLDLCELKVAWRTSANATCDNTQNCNNYPNGQCRIYECIDVETPLAANFSYTSSCVGTNLFESVVFTDESTGGLEPYSYSWDFGPDANPATANTEGPHTVEYSSGGSKMVTLTVTDSKTNAAVATYSQTITVGTCCNFEATCPANNSLGTFSCNTLNTIPACPVDEASAEAAPYNIQIGDSPCGTIVVLCTDSETPNECATANQNITRTVTVFDDLDNDQTLDAGEASQVCTFTIVIDVDNTAPEITCPADLILECDGDYANEIAAWLAGATASDACDSDVAISDDYDGSSLPSLSCDQSSGLVVTFRATDDCGNTATCTASIKIDDEVAPSISCPADLILECDGDYANEIAAWLDEASASDACDSDVAMSDDYDGSSLPSLSCDQSSGLVVTFRATDDCGNTATCTASIKIDDEVAPSISCPADLILECDGDYANEIAAWLAGATASDACDSDVAISDDYDGSSLPSLSCDQSSGLVVTFRATDDCGNTATCTASIKIDDEVAPSISCPADLILECDGDYANEIAAWLAGATASDACDSDVAISDDYDGSSLPSLSCDQSSGLVVTFRATDDCGNTATCTASIKIDDEVAPSISCPADLILECDGDYADEIAAWLAGASASDACDSDVAISDDYDGSSLPSLSCDQSSGLVVTFTATDDCGNTATCTASIKIDDEVAPSISCPADLILECDGDYADEIAAWLDEASASDVCDSDVAISDDYDGSSLPSLSCDQSSGLVVTFRATDDCGNTATCTASIKIDDEVAPSIACPADLILECDGDYANEIAAWLAGASASDACDSDVAISDDYDGSSLPSLSCDQSSGLVVTFTATDDCGNTATCTASIKIDDEVAPSISCPADLILECDGDYANEITAWLDEASASDACDSDVAISDDYDGSSLPSLSCDQSSGLVVTFTATDDCGNTATCTASIKIDDEVAPSISCPADLILECDGDYANEITAWLDEASASDACDSDVAMSDDYDGSSLPSLSCDQSSGLVVTFTATDDCGNTATCTASIKIDDEVAPSISCPADLILECDGDYANEITAWLDEASASDACDSDVAMSDDYDGSSLPSLSCDQSSGLVVTFTATDDCGNTATCTASIKIDDEVAPSISCPADLILECDGDYANEITAWLDEASASDACDSDVAMSDDYDGSSLPSLSCDQSSGLVVTFTATDDCGNTATCTASIKIDDEVAPSISCPADLTLACGSDFATQISNWRALARASDDCDSDVTIDDDYDGTSVPMPSCDQQSGEIIVTFTATDDCGNTATCARNIVLEQQGSAISNAPANVTVLCDQVPAPVVLTATFGCDAANVLFNEYTIPAVPAADEDYIIVRTWTVDDGCAEVTSVSQEIMVLCAEVCSFTQGFWGNRNGRDKDGRTTKELLSNLVSPANPVEIGSGNRILIIEDGDCIVELLPAGGSPSAFPSNIGTVVANAPKCDVPLIPTKKNGTLHNVLAGQVIALTLNIRYDEDSTLCDLKLADELCVQVHEDVLDELNDSEATVCDLLDLANKALGGEIADATLYSKINKSVTNINEYYDQCAPIVCQEEEDMGDGGRIRNEVSSEMQLELWPNPANEEVHITLLSSIDKKATVRMVDHTGHVFYEQSLSLAKGENGFTFDVSHLPARLYFVQLHTKDELLIQRFARINLE